MNVTLILRYKEPMHYTYKKYKFLSLPRGMAKIWGQIGPHTEDFVMKT